MAVELSSDRDRHIGSNIMKINVMKKIYSMMLAELQYLLLELVVANAVVHMDGLSTYACSVPVQTGHKKVV